MIKNIPFLSTKCIIDLKENANYKKILLKVILSANC